MGVTLAVAGWGQRSRRLPHFVPSRCSITARSSFMLHDNSRACEDSLAQFCLRSPLLPWSHPQQLPATGAVNIPSIVSNPGGEMKERTGKHHQSLLESAAKPSAILNSFHKVTKAKLRTYSVLCIMCRGVRSPIERNLTLVWLTSHLLHEHDGGAILIL